MKDVTTRFSFTDFVAYLFPGVLFFLPFTFAGYLFLNKWHPVLYFKIRAFVNSYPLGVFFVFIVSAYLLGSFSSSLILLWEKKLRSLFLKSEERENIKEYEEKIAKILKKVYSEVEFEDFSKDQLYFGRSIIREETPTCSLLAQRQNNVRQMRRNCIFPLITFFFLFVLVAIWSFAFHYGIFWAIFALGLAVFDLWLIYSLIRAGLISNRTSELREVYTALLLASKKLDSQS